MESQKIIPHDEDIHLKIDERDNMYYVEQQKILIHRPLPVLPTYSLTTTYLSYEAVVFALFIVTYLYRFIYYGWSYKAKFGDLKEVIHGKHSGKRLRLYAKWLLEDSASTGTLVVDLIVLVLYTIGLIQHTTYVLNTLRDHLSDAPSFNHQHTTNLHNDLSATILEHQHNYVTPKYAIPPEYFFLHSTFSFSVITLALLCHCTIGQKYHRNFLRTLIRWTSIDKLMAKYNPTNNGLLTNCFNKVSRCASNRLHSSDYQTLESDSDASTDISDNSDDNSDDSKVEETINDRMKQRRGLLHRLKKNKTRDESKNAKHQQTHIELSELFADDVAVLNLVSQTDENPVKLYVCSGGYFCDKTGNKVFEPSPMTWFFIGFIGENVYYSITTVLYNRAVDLIFVIVGAYFAGHDQPTAIYGEYIMCCLLIVQLLSVIFFTAYNALYIQARKLLLPLAASVCQFIGIILSVPATHPNRTYIDILCGINLLVILVVCLPIHFYFTSASYNRRRIWKHGHAASTNMYNLEKEKNI